MTKLRPSSKSSPKKKVCVSIQGGGPFSDEDVVALVSGGRDYVFVDEDRDWLTRMQKKYGFNIVRHGGATGADEGADEWARMNYIRRDSMPVSREEWNKYRHPRTGKSYAGMIRNQKMADKLPKPKVCLVFPGGNGTESMIKIAKKAGIPIEIQDNPRFVAWSNYVRCRFF
jgi:hypothetical protein